MASFIQRILAMTAVTSCFIASCASAPDKEKTPATDGGKDPIAVAPPPDWIKQSNIYEVNVRQYTKEGTFAAFSASLPRLKEMGVDVLWFMPITPISKTDRKGTLGSYYAVSDYTAVNPEFGTLDDFKKLVHEAHALGFKVITDWVANHTGADHKWLATHADFYNRGKDGTPIFAFDWSDTRDLNYDNKELRDSMTAAMQFWLRETDIDGFRCDVAAEVPADFWKQCIAELKKTKPGIFMLAEGDNGELHRAGFDASYASDMFQHSKMIVAGTRNATTLDSVLAREDAAFPKGAIRMYFTSNHDENSWNKSDFGTYPGMSHWPFMVFTQTMRNGIPLIYSGQEEPILRAIPFFEKDNMNMKNFRRAAVYKKLLELRKRNPALSTDASFKRISVGDDKSLYAYVREKDKHKILVILNLSLKEQTIQIKDTSLTGNPMNIFMGSKEPINVGLQFGIEPWGYIVYEY